MRSLTTIFAAIAIALSTCVAVNAAPQGNTSADRQLRQLEARYDTLSNLRYTNAYIEAEKRVIEAKIEKIKLGALSSKPDSDYSTSGSSASQSATSATELDITGPKDINNDPKQSPLWKVELSEMLMVNDDRTFLTDFSLTSRGMRYPMFSMDLYNLWNEELHALNNSAWGEQRELSAKLTFEGETFSTNVVIQSMLKEEFKDSECASIFMMFKIQQSEAPRVYRALTTKRFLSMTIGDVYIPLDQFTDSKIIFRALLDRLGTKVSKVRNL